MSRAILQQFYSCTTNLIRFKFYRLRLNWNKVLITEVLLHIIDSRNPEKPLFHILQAHLYLFIIWAHAHLRRGVHHKSILHLFLALVPSRLSNLLLCCLCLKFEKIEMFPCFISIIYEFKTNHWYLQELCSAPLYMADWLWLKWNESSSRLLLWLVSCRYVFL